MHNHRQQPRKQRWLRKQFSQRLVLVLGAIALFLGLLGLPAANAQLSLPDAISTSLPSLLNSTTPENIATGWVRLDGRPLFRIATPKGELSERLEEVQRNLNQIKQSYVNDSEPEINITIKNDQSLPILYVNDRYVMTGTHLDAQLQLTQPETYAQTLKINLMDAFPRARQEYQPKYLIGQGQKAIAILLTVIALSGLIRWSQKRFQRKERFAHLPQPNSNPETTVPPQITTRLTKNQQSNLGAVRRLVLQFSFGAIWAAGILGIMSLFPHTRGLQVLLVTRLNIYVIVLLTSLGIYIAARLSYVFIDRLIGTLLESAELMPRRSKRLQQRVSTISGVTKGLSTIVLVGVGILAALTVSGVDIAPFIAGAGLIGVAISLASQNLIKDAINGFLILVEDQYAVGDVIVVGEVFGLVEKITLRMTQLRDPEERLITIPNSEVRIVSNLSSHHSQADLQIPIAYSADIDKAFEVIEQICAEMQTDPDWRDRIIGDPQILGLDEFRDRGMIIRVWIKTPPLEQWNVAREYRRRLKRACDRAGVALMVSQQEAWWHSSPQPPSSHPPAVKSPRNSQLV
jgi:small-conductance mechanosensitive channel